MDPSGEPLFSDYAKEETEDSDGEKRLANKMDEEWPVKEEEPKRMEWTPGTEVSGCVTQKELNAEVKEEAVPPTSDQAEDSLPFAKLESFNAHLLLSNEYEYDVKKEEKEEERKTLSVEKNNCPVDGCSENFASLAGLEAHMKKHPRPVVCGICKRPFPYPSDLRQHYLMHTGEKRFACGFCNKRFADHSTLRRHIRSHTGERCIKTGNTDFGGNPKVDTPVVKEEVEDGEEWKYGGRTTKEGPEFGQNPEPIRRKWTAGTEASGDLTQKKRPAGVKKEVDSFSAVREDAVPSPSTDDSLPNAKLESFNAHVLFSNEYENAVKEEEEEERQNGAEERRNETDSRPRLMEPSRIHRGERPFQWDIRQDAFIQSHLKSQQRIHEDRPQWDIPGQKKTAEGAVDRQKCPVSGCSESLPSYADLVDHMKTHPGPVICGFCKKSFPYPSHLRRHYTTHTGEKRFACAFCDKRFPDSWHLAGHVRTHTGERPYECDFCEFKAADPSNLKNHKLIHRKEEENPFSCSFCDERFPTPSELTLHRRTHIATRTYECDICGYKATQLAILKNHRLSHFGKYACAVCGFKAANPATLADHRKRFNH